MIRDGSELTFAVCTRALRESTSVPVLRAACSMKSIANEQNGHVDCGRLQYERFLDDYMYV
jgi:hypothetical protein